MYVPKNNPGGGIKNNNPKIDLPLSGELGQTSQDSFVSNLKSLRSRDVSSNSPKSGESISPFWV